MATLTDDDMARIKREALDVLLSYGAIPYFRVRSLYDLIRDTVVSSSVAVTTTSATAVTAAGPAVVTLASVIGYATGQKVLLDVDGAREVVTVRAVVSSTISVICRRLHGGTYPVEVESPLTIVRGLLSDLAALDDQEQDAAFTAGIKKSDEVEWFGGAGERSLSDTLSQRRDRLRFDLCTSLGLGEILREGLARRGAAGGSVEPF